MSPLCKCETLYEEYIYIYIAFVYEDVVINDDDVTNDERYDVREVINKRKIIANNFIQSDTHTHKLGVTVVKSTGKMLVCAPLS